MTDMRERERMGLVRERFAASCTHELSEDHDEQFGRQATDGQARILQTVSKDLQLLAFLSLQRKGSTDERLALSM